MEYAAVQPETLNVAEEIIFRAGQVELTDLVTGIRECSREGVHPTALYIALLNDPGFEEVYWRTFQLTRGLRRDTLRAINELNELDQSVLDRNDQ